MVHLTAGRNELFPVPVFRFDLAEAAALKSDLIEAVNTARAEDRGVRVTNRGGWHSPKDLFDREVPAFKGLKAALLTAYDQVRAEVHGLSPGPAPVGFSGWANYNPPGSFNVSHEHLGSRGHWSGVYYAALDMGSGGDLVLEDQIYKYFGFQGGTRRIWRTAAGAALGPRQEVRVPPVEGRAIMFPSSLPHRVEPFQGGQARLSFAFNLTDPALSFEIGGPEPARGLRGRLARWMGRT
ncbi:MAG: TIGR02466 family protein [Rhodothalassiaceae bacterium]